MHVLITKVTSWSIDPPTQVKVSIVLNDSTLENGCIQVILGSQRS